MVFRQLLDRMQAAMQFAGTEKVSWASSIDQIIHIKEMQVRVLDVEKQTTQTEGIPQGRI